MTGQRLLHYEITGKLGEGGMGVVYKARDTHLDRFVAIKVLPPERVSDPTRKARFVQEAKAASALNHPNIITIHDISSDFGIDFIAMEYVRGKTLDQLIGRKGLAVSEGLEYAIQIASALAKAHAAGIIHRDLKPSNVMVTGDGLVKVLDFGLAKLTEPVEPEEAPTRTLKVEETPHTEEGTVLGTVAYMSPEQAEGKMLDARSDVFSFGAVLYEMLTGHRAFQRDSKLATLAAILREEPPPASQIVKGLAAEAERTIARCLRKDPARRFQTMADLKVALEEVKEESGSGRLAEPDSRPGRRVRSLRWAAVAAGVVLIASVAVVAVRFVRPAPATRQYSFTQLTDQPGLEDCPSLSPDGKFVIYASRASGNWDIYLQRVGGRNAVNLTKDCPADDIQPVFSPDGQRIAFRSERQGGGVFVMGATGESVVRVTDFGYHPAWSPDGREIVCATANFRMPNYRRTSGSRLFAVNLDASPGPARTRRVAGPEDAVQPTWSPHGHRIAYWGLRGGQRDIWTAPSRGGRPVPVTADPYLEWNPVWSPDGKYLYFASDRAGSMNFWRVRIEEKSGKLLAAPELITTPSLYSGYLSFTSDGQRMCYVQFSNRSNLQKVAFDPTREAVLGPPVSVTHGARVDRTPDLSPDGEWLVFYSAGKQDDLFLIHTDGTGFRQLTNDIHSDRAPHWSPDGSRIAYMSTRSGKYEVWMMKPDGSGVRQLTYDPRGDALGPAWAPDGKRLAYGVRGVGTFVIEVEKPWSEQTPHDLGPPGEPGTWFWVRAWSPDGRSLSGDLQGPEGGYSGIGIYMWESKSYRRLTTFGAFARWLSDSRRLLFLDEEKVYLLDSESRRVREILSVAPHELGPLFALSRDNRLIVFALRITEGDVWLMSTAY